MKKLTKHFKKRLDERIQHPEEVMKRFKEMLKLIKSKKRHPYFKEVHKDEKEIVYGAYYKGINYVYAKKHGDYILITIYQTPQHQKKLVIKKNQPTRIVYKKRDN